MKQNPVSGSHLPAFSVPELIVTVAIVAVIAAIGIPVYSNLHDASEKAIARDHVEALNRAMTNFSQACWKIPTAANASSTDDEYKVLRSLQYKFPVTNLKVGSPYFDTRYDPPASSSASHLRIRWNGQSFELLEKGQAGTGLRFYSGADFNSSAYTFPSGYKPEGAI